VRSEEEPDEDEPERDGSRPAGPMVPTVAGAGCEWEYRSELLTLAQVTDGETLAKRLTAASAEGWDLFEVVDAGDKRALLLRRPKQSRGQPRRVGFAPPDR